MKPFSFIVFVFSCLFIQTTFTTSFAFNIIPNGVIKPDYNSSSITVVDVTFNDFGGSKKLGAGLTDVSYQYQQVSNDFTYIEGTETYIFHFESGSPTNLEWSLTEDGAVIAEGYTEGSYTSEVFDLSEDKIWDRISWNVLRSEPEVDDYTKLLLHFDGQDDSTNDADFVDSSQYNHEVSQVLNAKIEDSQTKYGDTSLFVDGNGDHARVEYNPMFDLNDDNFTIELWVYQNTTGIREYFIGSWINGNNDDQASFLLSYRETEGKYRFHYKLEGQTYSDADFGSQHPGEWVHLAVVRDGTNLYGFVNGVKTVLSTSLGTSSFDKCDGCHIEIGSASNGSTYPMNGFVDEVRFSKGIARWIDNFTPPTGYYAYGLSGVSVRSCDDPVCDTESWEPVDISGDSADLIVDDNQYFQYKFDLFRELDESIPIAFDVTLDYSDPPHADFTYIEGTDNFVYDFESGYQTNLGWSLSEAGAVIAEGYTVGSYTSEVFDLSEDKIWDRISWNVLRSEPEIDDYTKLLLHFDGADDSTNDADFVDSSKYNHEVSQVLNAKIEDSQAKYGDTSLFVYGNGDHARVEYEPMFDLNNDDFTVELWVYQNRTGVSEYFIGSWINGNNDDQASFLLSYRETEGKYRFHYKIEGQTYGYADFGSQHPGEWVHLAVVRDGTNLYGFVNGVKTVLSTSLGTSSFDKCDGCHIEIGSASNGSTYPMDGFVDEVRFSKGIARWIDNFTPPTGYYAYGLSGVSVRSCDDPVCDTESWEPVDISGDSADLIVDDNQYFQYKLDLFRELDESIPIAYDVTIEYSEADSEFTFIDDGVSLKAFGYLDGTLNGLFYGQGFLSLDGVSSGSFESQIFDMGSSAVWDNLSIDVTTATGALIDRSLDESKVVPNGIDMRGNEALLHLDGVVNILVQDTSKNQQFFQMFNFDCTPADCAVVDGMIGNAINFDGVDDRIDLGDSFNSLSDATVSFWMKPDSGYSSGGDSEFLFEKYNDQANRLLFYLQGSSGKGIWFIEINDEIKQITTQRTSWNDDWYHIVLQCGSGGMKMYVNGVLETETDASTYCFNDVGSGVVEIGDGKYYGNYLYPFDGKIDEVSIWGRALSADEIESLYERAFMDLQFSIKACDDSECLGESWQLITTRNPIPLELDSSQYLQYRLDFSTKNMSYLPGVYTVTIDHDHDWCYRADINKDGNADISDLSLLSASFNSVCTEGDWCGDADINKDLYVDYYDSDILDAKYGRTDCSN